MSVPCQKIDPAQWPRSESFAFFSSLDQPFYSVCFRVDVTALHAYTKTNGLSFYHSMVWLVTQAVNETENLRYTLRGGEVYLLPARTPNFTELKKGSEQFRYPHRSLVSFTSRLLPRGEGEKRAADRVSRVCLGDR